jgi:hypothetical protein
MKHAHTRPRYVRKEKTGLRQRKNLIRTRRYQLQHAEFQKKGKIRGGLIPPSLPLVFILFSSQKYDKFIAENRASAGASPAEIWKSRGIRQ